MKRAHETLLRSYLKAFPCVALVGVRQCGKTTLLGTLPPAWKRFDLERMADYRQVANDPDTFFRLNQRQVAIDEAQVLPAIFPSLRVAIDDHRAEKGRFVITGSSSPSLLRSISESLAGRVGIIEMAPFSWAEVRGASARNSFLRRLLDPKAAPGELLSGLKPLGSLAEVHDYWFRGGYPEPWLNRRKGFHAVWAEQYLQTYLMRDVKRLFPNLDEIRFRRFVEMLGGLSGQVINYADTARALAVSQPTARDYFAIAHGTFLWRTLPAYTRDTVKRVVKHPRGYLRDSGLLHALLRIPDLETLLAHPAMGSSWEGMVIEEILRRLGAYGVGHDASYYRTGAGAEVDLVVEGDFGRVAFEIRYGSAISSRELRPLRDFVGEQKCRLGVVVSNDERPRLHDDRLVGIPFACL